ncbi:hypothetical protein AXG93_3005s1190 [Marchantia polymorpha subsp. ruderalis]|uniref:Uncharacterized protein n=1 Tax=Marchantia polymorpha subsp. ruderalis TaxID=1480154 RepID=A0A176WN17_MARPO|nr:hypothetical protein AXG93_3005s1190 [Marchantia polymorpha subsp. ruderalis]
MERQEGLKPEESGSGPELGSPSSATRSARTYRTPSGGSRLTLRLHATRTIHATIAPSTALRGTSTGISLATVTRRSLPFDGRRNPALVNYYWKGARTQLDDIRGGPDSVLKYYHLLAIAVQLNLFPACILNE